MRRRISEEELRQRIRANVRALRAAAGLTVKQIAERAGLNARHWQKIEAGGCNVTAQTISKLCAALQVDPADLIDDPARLKEEGGTSGGDRSV